MNRKHANADWSRIALSMVVGCGVFSSQAMGGADDGMTKMRVSPPTLIARQTEEPIKLDGELSEGAWQSAAPSGGFSLVLEADTQAAQQTQVRAVYDETHLYIGMVCEEPNVSQLVKRAAAQGAYPGSDDRVAVYVGVHGLEETYCQFVVSAGNIRYECKARAYADPFVFYGPHGMVQTTKGREEVDDAWSIGWSSATKEGEGRWTVEVALPLEVLGIGPVEGQVARANFSRMRVTNMPSPWGRGMRPNIKPEESAWSSPKGSMGTPGLFGFIAFADKKGNVPSTPASMDVGVPGMPGMPGAVKQVESPERVRFTVKSEDAGRRLVRFWDGLGGPQLSGLEDGLVARTFERGYFTKVRLDRTWPRNARVVDGKLEGDLSVMERAYDKVKEKNLTAITIMWHVPQEIEYVDPRGRRLGGALQNEADYRVIYAQYKAYFQHIHDRYGKAFLDRQRFELWNEPDWTGQFFGGTVEDYYKWYAWVSKALKDVSPDGKIGGPAVTGGGFDFTRAFLDLCRSARNPATGGIGAPVDFVSFHTYGWRAQLTPYASQDVFLTLGRMWAIMKETGFAGTETIVSEFGMEPTGALGGPYFWFRRNQYAPTWLARFVKLSDDAVHTYSDLGARLDGALIHIAAVVDSPAFHGSCSLFTEGYVPKPYFNGYVLLNELGETRLVVEGPEDPDIGCMATRRGDGSLAILVYHFKEYQKTSPREEDTVIELAGLPAQGVRISQKRVDETTSNSYTAWLSMGSPEPITGELAEQLTTAAEVRKSVVKAGADGVVELVLPVNSVAVVLVEQVEQAD